MRLLGGGNPQVAKADGDAPVLVGSLCAEALPPNRRDGMRYVVHSDDRDRTGVSAFLCRSFEVSRATG
ncbi:MAG: hypothetical protein JNK15_02380 [Planctomycetes bacterium]|nr:hypothetical protein [Planctomycetota bacterium]